MNLHKFIPLCILFLSGAYAQAAPPFVTYAGQVASGGQPFNGTGQFKFAFVMPMPMSLIGATMVRARPVPNRPHMLAYRSMVDTIRFYWAIPQ